jgi:hypothetical protein
MLKRTFACALAAFAIPFCAMGQSHSAFPVDSRVLAAPVPVLADGRLRLLYEVQLTNFSTKRVEITGLNVVGRDGVVPLATYQEGALEKLVVPVGPEDNKEKERSIGPGRSITLFLDLALRPKEPLPTELRHTLYFSYVAKDGGLIREVVNGPVVSIRQTADVIQAPLRGSGWVAINGLSNPHHRRSFNAVDGHEHLAQRFAIDWVKLGPDGRFWQGPVNSNSSYYDYGEEVLAVADGRVSGLRDGLPENAGNNPAAGRDVTLDTITGNSVILDLGRGRFALYAHLQPQSLRVKVGDHVKAGQVLARLGNTGNSDAPHLHFQLMDANSALGAEGLPYVFASFTQLGVLNDPDVWDKGKAWRPEAPVASVHRREFPVDNAVVSFP